MVQVDSNYLYIGITQLQTADDDTRNTAKTVDSYLDFITHLRNSFLLSCLAGRTALLVQKIISLTSSLRPSVTDAEARSASPDKAAAWHVKRKARSFRSGLWIMHSGQVDQTVFVLFL
jgi:hypothetical protein